MKNFFKNIDLSQIQDRVSDLKSQVEDLRFQKPWTTNRSSSPLVLLVVGAGLAAVGVALYKNRSKVAKLCNQCGDEIKSKFNEINSSDYSRETANHI